MNLASYIQKIRKILLKNLTPLKVVVVIGLVFYLPIWIWTISLSFDQVGRAETILPVFGTDSLEYSKLANNIFSHGCFSQDDCKVIETFRTPGYPFFVAVLSLFGSPFIVTFVQCILALLSGIFLQKIISPYVGYRVSMYLMVLFLLEPSMIIHPVVILSDTVYTFLIIWAFYLLMRSEPTRRSIVYIGLILGVSALFRPISIFISPVFIVAYIILYPRIRKKILLFAAGVIIFFLIPILPWMVRNYVQTGSFALSSVSNYNFLFYNIPLYLAHREGSSVIDVQKRFQTETGLEVVEWRDSKNAPIISELVKKYISDNFVGYTVFHLYKSIPFFFGSSVKNAVYSYNYVYMDDEYYFTDEGSASDFLLNKNYSGLFRRIFGQPVFFLEYIFWLLVCGVSIAGLFSKHRRFVIILAMLIFYFAVLTGPVSHVRYRLPAEPFMLMAFGIGVGVLYGVYVSRSTKKLL